MKRSFNEEPVFCPLNSLDQNLIFIISQKSLSGTLSCDVILQIGEYTLFR